MNFIKCGLFIFSLLFSVIIFAQVTDNNGTPLKEGIYLTLKDFKENKPIPKKKVILAYDINSLDYLKQATTRRILKYSDENNNPQKIKIIDIWGYCENNALYKKEHLAEEREYSYKVQVVGSICLYLGSKRVGAMIAAGIVGVENAYVGRNQYMIDTENGEVMNAGAENLSRILKKDTLLYDEFHKLDYSNQQRNVFIVVKKYNDKHPFIFSK